MRMMVDSYGEQLYSMIVCLTGNVQDAEELTQDTFVRAYRHIHRFDPSLASLSTWLCRIAYRLTLDHQKRRHIPTVSIYDSVDEMPDISDEELENGLSTGNEERISRLETLIRGLPPDDRLLLSMYYFENRKLDECAHIMNTTPGALAVRLHRLRRKLYQQLKTI